MDFLPFGLLVLLKRVFAMSQLAQASSRKVILLVSPEAEDQGAGDSGSARKSQAISIVLLGGNCLHRLTGKYF